MAQAPTAQRRTNRGAPALPDREVPGARRRRILRRCSTVLIAAGVLLVLDAGVTVAWQEPITAYTTSRTQQRLADDLDRLRAAPVTPAEQAALATLTDQRRRIALLARSLQRSATRGDAVGRIRIPAIGASFVVVDGTSAADLRKGPGLYDGMAFPGAGPVAAIAGHRTTYLAPFRNIDELHRGDPITVAMPYATFTYAVQRTRIVAPDDFSILTPHGGAPVLVLTACHPLFSASQRIVVTAVLVRSEPGVTLARSGRPGGAGIQRPANGLLSGPPPVDTDPR